MSELNFVPIHRSLHRPNLILGAEREPLFLSMLLPVAFTLSSFSGLMLATSIIFWIIASFFLRNMAKSDPDMGKIWLRFRKYQNYYPAQPTVWQQSNSNKQK